MKTAPEKLAAFPKKLKEGSAKVTIYRQANPSRRRNSITGAWEPTGAVHDEFVLAYYHGVRQVVDPTTQASKSLPKLVRCKFARCSDAEREARFVLVRLASAEGDVLKLTGLDRAAYVQATQRLHEWRADADLNLAIADYVAAARRLPATTSLQMFKHYRQVVTETQAREWFSIVPPRVAGAEIIPLTTATATAVDAGADPELGAAAR